MTIAAYAFTTPSLLSADGLTFDSIRKSDYLQVFRTGWDCRCALAHTASAVQTIVSEEVDDVAALNLIAALHYDEPQRDIYMATKELSAALSSRVRAAGGRGIIDDAQVRTMVGLEQDAKAQRDEATAADEDIPADGPAPIAQRDAKTIQAAGGAEGKISPAIERQSLEQSLPQIPHIFAENPSVPAKTASPTHTPIPFLKTDGCAVAFVSGRGGVGKSTLSLLTAILLQRRGFKVALLDLDLQFGDLAYFVGQTSESAVQRMGLDAAINGPGCLQPSAERLCLIEAPLRPEYAEEHMEEISGFIASLTALADYVILNTGSFWSEFQAVLAKKADKLIFVMDQRATSVRGCKQAVDLCVRLQIPSVRFGFLLNRCARNAPLTTLDVSLALGGVEVYGIADGGHLVDEMLSLGNPYGLLDNDAALQESFEQLLASLKVAGHSSQTPHARVAPALGALSSIIRGRKKGGLHVAF